MSDISSGLVKELRGKTGAGIMDCKKALQEAEGNLESAVEYLRKKGIAKAGKKSERTAAEGIIGSYIHSGGKIGVLLEVNCETDFVAKTDDFQDMVKDIAMHIAAMNPGYVKREEVPGDVIEKEKIIFKEQMAESGKPENIIDKIVEGKIGKFYSEICLLEQAYVKEPEKTIEDIVKEKIAKLGENIVINKFVRFKIGEK